MAVPPHWKVPLAPLEMAQSAMPMGNPQVWLGPPPIATALAVTGSELLPIRAAVTIRGSDILLDFDGTGPQARGALNLSRSGLEATCAYAVKTMLDPEIPPNSGLFGGIEITEILRNVNEEPHIVASASSSPYSSSGGRAFGAVTSEGICDRQVGADEQTVQTHCPNAGRDKYSSEALRL